MSVTLMSRPDTPRFRRSSASSVPTLVRGSAPNQLDSCARVYVRVDRGRKPRIESWHVAFGTRSGHDPMGPYVPHPTARPATLSK